MPTRKQRRRRAKERRHEYEEVLVYPDGREVPLEEIEDAEAEAEPEPEPEPPRWPKDGAKAAGEGKTKAPAEGKTKAPAEGKTKAPAEGKTKAPAEGKTRAPARGKTKTSARRQPASRSRKGATPAGTGGRTVQPASWRRVLKRAAIFAPLMFIFIRVSSNELTTTGQLLVTAQMLLILIPFMYVMDMFLFRMWKKRADRARG